MEILQNIHKTCVAEYTKRIEPCEVWRPRTFYTIRSHMASRGLGNPCFCAASFIGGNPAIFKTKSITAVRSRAKMALMPDFPDFWRSFAWSVYLVEKRLGSGTRGRAARHCLQDFGWRHLSHITSKVQVKIVDKLKCIFLSCHQKSSWRCAAQRSLKHEMISLSAHRIARTIRLEVGAHAWWF